MRRQKVPRNSLLFTYGHIFCMRKLSWKRFLQCIIYTHLVITIHLSNITQVAEGTIFRKHTVFDALLIKLISLFCVVVGLLDNLGTSSLFPHWCKGIKQIFYINRFFVADAIPVIVLCNTNNFFSQRSTINSI